MKKPLSRTFPHINLIKSHPMSLYLKKATKKSIKPVKPTSKKSYIKGEKPVKKCAKPTKKPKNNQKTFFHFFFFLSMCIYIEKTAC